MKDENDNKQFLVFTFSGSFSWENGPISSKFPARHTTSRSGLVFVTFLIFFFIAKADHHLKLNHYYQFIPPNIFYYYQKHQQHFSFGG